MSVSQLNNYNLSDRSRNTLIALLQRSSSSEQSDSDNKVYALAVTSDKKCLKYFSGICFFKSILLDNVFALSLFRSFARTFAVVQMCTKSATRFSLFLKIFDICSHPEYPTFFLIHFEYLYFLFDTFWLFQLSFWYILNISTFWYISYFLFVRQKRNAFIF